MKRNSRLFDCFMKAGDEISPKLAWKAGTLSAHYAWRKKFKVEIGNLLGRMPARVPQKVEWGEKVEKKVGDKK